MMIFKKLAGLYRSATAKDTIAIGLGNLISSGLAIITMIIVARALGPESWGIVAVFLSFVTILVSFEDLGFGASLFRYAARAFNKKDFESASEILKIVFSIRFVTAVLFAILLVVTAPFSSQLIFKINQPLYIWFGAICIFSYSLLDFQITALQSEQRWKTSAFFIGLTNAIRLLLVLLLPSNLRNNLLAILGVFSISSFVTLFLTFFFIRIKLELHYLKSSKLKEIAKFAGWLGFNRIIGVTSARIDVLMLYYLASTVNTGIFGAAKQLAIGVPIIIGSFATVIAPRFSSLDGSHLWRYYQKTVVLSIFISVILVGFLFLVNPVMNLFGSEYDDAKPLLKWLIISYIPIILSTPAVNLIIYALKKPNIVAILTLVQFPFALIANLYLIPRYETWGPVVTQNVINLTTLIFTSLFIWKIKNKIN